MKNAFLSVLLSAATATVTLAEPSQSAPAPPLASTASLSPTPTPTPEPDWSSKARRFSDAEITARRNAAREKEALLERILAGMGGADRVDSIQTLVLVGKSWKVGPGGPVETEDRTSFRFPHFYRLDVTLPAGVFSKLVTPEGSYLIGPTGAVQLPEPERRAVEASIARNPLVLLKTRRDRSFWAEAAGTGQVGGRTVDLLTIRVVFDSMTVAIERGSGRVLELRYPTWSEESEKSGILTVSYSDFRSVGGLTYPFVAVSSFDSRKVSESRLREMQVDAPLNAKIFRPPLVLAVPPTPTTTPAFPPNGR